MLEMKVQSLVALPNHFAFHRWSAQIAALLLLSAGERSCCKAGTNGRPDSRYSAFPPGERVRAEWNRCPGSMARRFKGSLAPSSTVRVSKLPQECDAWCHVFGKWLEVLATHERTAQRYSELFELGEKGQGSSLKLTFRPRLTSLLLRCKIADTVFVVLSFDLQVWSFFYLHSPCLCWALRSTSLALNNAE